MISFDQGTKRFHIQGPTMSYIMQVGADAQVHHLYWGKRLELLPAFLDDRAPYRRASIVEGQPADSPKCSWEYFHYECPTYGLGDFRLPALQAVEMDSGSALCDMRYESYRISEGRKAIQGLPYAHGENSQVQTLEIFLRDSVNGLRAVLSFHLFGDVITRHMTVINDGKSDFILEQAMSATVDFEDGEFSLFTLNGTTLREFTPSVHPLHPGVTEISSSRGSSSHQHNPNIALLRTGADQHQGEVYGFSMIYSGNFTLRAEVDQYRSCRLQGGINPLGFAWNLAPGAQFDTPEIVLSWSAEGLNGLSAHLHSFVHRHILREGWNNRQRPLLLNTWEACYFDVSHERLYQIGKKASECGIELIVLDDGWFGHRNEDNSSLGDWFVNTEKFPGGLDALADALADLPLQLGIWLEPEMISPDSELYRTHPDWCLHADGRVRTQWRNQLVLDMGRDDVVDYLTQCIDKLMSTGKIAYIKWDLNRRITQPLSAVLDNMHQGEVFHRYILGTYRLLQHVSMRYPDVLMENCASGGGRFDYGMLCYFHQGWLSDNTDPVSRLTMQNAASAFFPPAVITSHISASPNHQNGRETPYHFRDDVCLLFNAGYEINVLEMPEEEKKNLFESSRRIKALRDTVLKGRFTRLNKSLTPEEWFGWMVEDDRRAVIGYFRPYCRTEAYYWTIPLHGLDPDAIYCDTRTGEKLTGATWEAVGLRPDWRNGDYYSQIIVLEKTPQRKIEMNRPRRTSSRQ